jgi:hypothetical protein
MPLEAQAQLQVYLDGQKLRNLTSVTMNTDGGKIPIYTLDRGLIGFSLGSGQVSLTLEYALPAAGQEYPFQQKSNTDEEVTLQFVGGAEHYTGVGQIMTDEKSQSVNAQTTGTCTWTGERNPVQ